MSAIPFGTAPRRLGALSDEQRPENPMDSAWLVLDAANDFRDDATVAACRRVIDANLNGVPAQQTDLRVIFDYFK
jgi:hypothetical protein